VKIAVVMPTHERAGLGWRVLPLGLAGVLRQTHGGPCVVVYDPGTDLAAVHEPAIAAAIGIARECGVAEPAKAAAERIRAIAADSPLVGAKRNTGIRWARNAGVDIAVQMDDDDVYLPDYLAAIDDDWTKHPDRMLCTHGLVGYYDLPRRRRSTLDNWGGAVHASRTDLIDRLEYGTARVGEDSQYNAAIGKLGLPAAGLDAAAAGQVVLCRYGVGHTWMGVRVRRSESDRGGEWFRRTVGEAIAERYLALAAPLVVQKPGTCGDCRLQTRRWGLTICRAVGLGRSLGETVARGAIVRNMAACPQGRWKGAKETKGTKERRHEGTKGNPLAGASGSDRAVRRAICGSCEHYTHAGPDPDHAGYCEALATRQPNGALCLRHWHACLDGRERFTRADCRNAAAVSLITVHHDTPELLAIQLERMKRHGRPDAVYVADNGSAPHNAAAIAELCTRHGATLVRSETNEPHGEALDRLVRLVPTPWVLAMDSDAWPIRDGWLDAFRPADGEVLVGASAGLKHAGNPGSDYAHPAACLAATNFAAGSSFTHRWPEWDTGEKLTIDAVLAGKAWRCLPSRPAGEGRSGVVVAECVYHAYYATRLAVDGSDRLARLDGTDARGIARQISRLVEAERAFLAGNGPDPWRTA
jgi:hypothetical protein